VALGATICRSSCSCVLPLLLSQCEDTLLFAVPVLPSVGTHVRGIQDVSDCWSAYLVLEWN
jgi:hypothetical protein